MAKQCKIEGCINNVFTHGYCYNHKGCHYKAKSNAFKKPNRKTSIRPLSKQKALKKATIASIKKNIIKTSGDVCFFCGRPTGNDAAHIFPISLFPEYEAEPWNIILSCRDHHVIYDDGTYTDLVQIPNISFVLEIIESIYPNYITRLKKRDEKEK